MKWARICVVVIGFASFIFIASPTHAVSLKIAPLRYQTTLKSGETQKGYVDVSNPTAETLTIGFEVRGFRQINDTGGVEFYQEDAVSAGVRLDLDSIELGPAEVIRLYFLIDSAKLPQGQVYAAIFARTMPSDVPGSAQSVRVGTILEILNGDAGPNHATITSFAAPFLQIGDHVSARFTVKNENTTGGQGFRPALAFGVRPYDSTDIEGPLVFKGRSRTVEYSRSGDYFGIVWLQANTANSTKGAVALVITGYWRWLAPLLLVMCGALFFSLRRTLRKKR